MRNALSTSRRSSIMPISRFKLGVLRVERAFAPLLLAGFGVALLGLPRWLDAAWPERGRFSLRAGGDCVGEPETSGCSCRRRQGVAARRGTGLALIQKLSQAGIVNQIFY